MKEFWNAIQLVFTAVGGWLGYFLGGCDGLLIALVVFAVADYITGLMCAVVDRNPCYTAGKKITVKGLMLHSVGCPQPNASAFINSWNSASYSSACVHGFIDGNDGTVYQTLPWNHRGWHCGSGSNGSGNNSYVGVEMCEPACIKYTSGANFTCSDTATAKTVVQRTYEAAVELFAMLCQKYSLDPLADGVVISHKEGCKRGIASNHGDPEHLWSQLGLSYTMDTFRAAVKAAMGGGSASAGASGTKIMGTAVATATQMQSYIQSVNPSVPQSVLDMITLYLSEGAAEGVRGDIAFAQSCLETGNFGFSSSAVTLNQNNFCGMGVTANGEKGNSFDTPKLGIRAQIQHLKAYATTDALKNECVDPRFNYVTRGCAEYVEWLGQQENPNGRGWAAGAGYGQKILAILQKVTAAADATDGSSSSLYRVRRTWADSKTQKGAYKILENAKKCADANPGYSVFDANGVNVYTPATATVETEATVPFLVKVAITDLNIRTGPGTNYAKTGKFTGVGVFTITEVEDGPGSAKGWGRLKSGSGWISLEYTART